MMCRIRHLTTLLLVLAPPQAPSAQSPAPAVSVHLMRGEAPSATVAVSPARASIPVGGSLRFTAVVTGTSEPRVTWTATGGSMASDGTFIAPLVPGTVRVLASIAGGMSGAAEIVTTPAVVEIHPGQNIQSVVTAAPPGTTFLLKAGVHRMQTIRPRDGDTFTGEPGAVLSGARVITFFTRSASYYVAAGQTQEGSPHGQCQAAYPACRLPEELFIDDRVLTRVGSLDQVGPGRWYFDYAADRIYFADDPEGRRVETSVVPTAVEASADRVSVSGLTVEKYANLAQHGAISAEGRTGWVIARNEIRWNHGLGVRIGPGTRAIANHVHHNGQLGMGGVGNDVLVEKNEIAYNNTARFDADWEAGGAKFVQTDRLMVRENVVHHNGGPGLWTDIDNINTIYERNIVDDNERMGIFHEISYAAIIRDNVVRRNGLGFRDWIWGAGILVAASPNVEIHGNTVEDNADGIGAVQQRRGAGAHGPHEVSNLWVHDNNVRMSQGCSGLVQDVDDVSYFSSRNNRFERNWYWLTGIPAFAWRNAEVTEDQWKAFGQDRAGSFFR